MTEMLTGTACSDVTGRLYERIYQIAADGKNAAIVVPDQFVFETEKALSGNVPSMAEPSCSLIYEF